MGDLLKFPTVQTEQSRPERIRETLQHFIDNVEGIGSIAIVAVSRDGMPCLYTAAETPAMLCALARSLENEAAQEIEMSFRAIGDDDGDAA